MQNREFSHSYNWEILSGTPPGQVLISYPKDSQWYSIGFLVEITPHKGKSWVGNFSGSGFDFLSSVFPTPNENIVGINSQGAVYFVNTIAPPDFVEVPIMPVVDVIPSYQYELMLLVGFTHVGIYDRSGMRWIKKVSADGIKIKGVDEEKISGLAWNPAKSNWVDFEIEIKTAKLLGGSA